MPWNWPNRASTSSSGQASPTRARPKGWRGAPPVIRETRPTKRGPRDRKPRMGGSHDREKDPSREREGTADPARLAGGQGRTRSPGGPLRRLQSKDQAGPDVARHVHPGLRARAGHDRRLSDRTYHRGPLPGQLISQQKNGDLRKPAISVLATSMA